MVGLRWRSMSQMRLTGLQLAWYARNSYLLGVLHALLLGRAASTCLPGAGSLSGQRGKARGKLPVSAWGLARRQAMKAWLTGCWDWRRMCTKTAPAQSRKWGCACCRTMETPISRWDLSKGRKAKQTHMSQEYEQSWEGIQHIHTSARTCTHTYMTVHAQSHTHAYIHLPYNLHFFYKHHITPRRTTSHHIASHHMTWHDITWQYNT